MTLKGVQEVLVLLEIIEIYAKNRKWKKKCTFALKIKALLKVKKKKKTPKDVVSIERDKGCEATCTVLSTQ